MPRENKSLKYLDAELKFDRSVKRGSRARKTVKRVQEWLCLNEEYLTVDGLFGPATEAAVQRFQNRSYLLLETLGVVTPTTFKKLSSSLGELKDLKPPASTSVRSLSVRIAGHFCEEHARESGGQNRGPWVRLFNYGLDGKQYPWCAGFVSWCLDYAAHLLDQQNPLGEHTLSCDRLAKLAKDKGIFLSAKDVRSGIAKPKPGQLFLLTHKSRKNDWIHTGFVLRSRDETFETLEGNTNDGGSREGYGVFRRTRSFNSRYDFILL